MPRNNKRQRVPKQMVIREAVIHPRVLLIYGIPQCPLRLRSTFLHVRVQKNPNHYNIHNTSSIRGSAAAAAEEILQGNNGGEWIGKSA